LFSSNPHNAVLIPITAQDIGVLNLQHPQVHSQHYSALKLEAGEELKMHTLYQG